MADAIYVLEKLIQVVDALATGAGRVQERLGHAAIHLFRGYPEDISDQQLLRTFIGVILDLSYAQAHGGRRILATLKTMGDEDAMTIARRILELFHELDRLLRER